MPPVKTVRLTPSQLASLGSAAIERPMESLGEVEISYPQPYVFVNPGCSVRVERFQKNTRLIEERAAKLEILKHIIQEAGVIDRAGIYKALENRGITPRNSTVTSWLRELKDFGVIEIEARSVRRGKNGTSVNYYSIKGAKK